MAIAYDPSVERFLQECEEGMDGQPKSEEKWHGGPEKIIVTEIAYCFRFFGHQHMVCLAWNSGTLYHTYSHRRNMKPGVAIAWLDCPPLKSADASHKDIHFTPPSVLEPRWRCYFCCHLCSCVEYSRFKLCKLKCSRNFIGLTQNFHTPDLTLLNIFVFHQSKVYFIAHLILLVAKPSQILMTVEHSHLP